MADKQTDTKKIILAVIAIIYAIALIFVGKSYVERAAVKSTAEQALFKIKQGLDDDTMNEVVDEAISMAMGDGAIGTFLQNQINGDDLNDIYQVLIRNMAYEVYAVEKTESGVYRLGVAIQNNNNIEVIKYAAELFVQRYNAGIIEGLMQAWDDLNSDKSELLASLISESAKILEAERGTGLLFTQYYVIGADTDGNLDFENDNGQLSFILACAGIEVSSGSAPDIHDEYNTYKILFIALVLVGIAGAVYFVYGKSKAKKTGEAVQSVGTYPGATAQGQPAMQAQTALPNYTTAQGQAAQSRTPVLYAQSVQHGNTPYAVHGSPIMIGRDRSSCKVVFKEGSAGVSSRHCSLSYDAGMGQFVLVDLRSTYGTFLANGEKLTPNKQYYLKPGDGFFVGDRANMFKVEMG